MRGTFLLLILTILSLLLMLSLLLLLPLLLPVPILSLLLLIALRVWGPAISSASAEEDGGDDVAAADDDDTCSTFTVPTFIVLAFNDLLAISLPVNRRALVWSFITIATGSFKVAFGCLLGDDR